MSWRLCERCCPICGPTSSAHEFSTANVNTDQLDAFAFASRKMPEYMHWRLWCCQQCDLVYANPAPPVDDLASLYREASFASAREARFASQTYGQILRTNVISKLAELQSALDIGTGDGAFLHELLDAGFSEVVGIEPSSAPIEVADARVRPLIQQGLFEPNTFSEERFSVVTCFQTIEHVPDPLGLCREAQRILKPGGALLLIGHNRRALSAKLLGRKSPIFDIEHLQLFSPESFHHLLSAAGLTSIRVFSFWNRYPLSYWTGLVPLPKTLKQHFLRFLSATRLGKLSIALPAGNLVAVGFKAAALPPDEESRTADQHTLVRQHASQV